MRLQRQDSKNKRSMSVSSAAVTASASTSLSRACSYRCHSLLAHINVCASQMPMVPNILHGRCVATRMGAPGRETYVRSIPFQPGGRPECQEAQHYEPQHCPFFSISVRLQSGTLKRTTSGIGVSGFRV